MSHNLRLSSANSVKDCPLFQTPSDDTARILKDEKGLQQSRFVVMQRYFKWVDKHFKNAPGWALDHKLEVAMFLVQYPHAHWFSS